MKKFHVFFLALFLMPGLKLNAQSITPQKSKSRYINRKGRIYFYFGWNRSTYTKSDIHFRGTGYNFTLSKVVARDRPTPFDLFKYINPTTITIPQYQYRIGYYLTDKYSLSWGFNHMKYVMVPFQTVTINGYINNPDAGVYNGTYKNQKIQLTKDFLQFEHTNGLNYLDFELARTETLWQSKRKHTNLSVVFGVGAGVMFPKSDVVLFGKERDHWHVAGYAFSALGTLRFEFLKRFFVQAQFDGGYINMPDIITSGDIHARARQHFFFAEESVMIGSYFRLGKSAGL